MVARAYPDLGGIGGVQNNQQVAYSSRGLDQDRVQTFVFEDDTADPFIGTIHLQGSNDAPLASTPAENRLWVDLVAMTLDGVAPVGNFFVETSIEISQVRLVCKTGNYTSGRIISCQSMR
jgi:hypothetical protein